MFANHISDKGLISSTQRNADKSTARKCLDLKMNKGPDQTFLKWIHTKDQQIYEKYFISLIIREMQIKTRMTYHLTPLRMGVIRKTEDGKCWPGCRVKGILVHCLWEYKFWELSWYLISTQYGVFFMELPYDTAISLLGIYSEDGKPVCGYSYLHTYICL